MPRRSLLPSETGVNNRRYNVADSCRFLLAAAMIHPHETAPVEHYIRVAQEYWTRWALSKRSFSVEDRLHPRRRNLVGREFRFYVAPGLCPQSDLQYPPSPVLYLTMLEGLPTSR